MSGIWGWFGGGGSQRGANAPKNAILGLRSQLDMLQKRENHLLNQINEQDAIARKNVNTNKTGMSDDIGIIFLPKLVKDAD
jgi:charged multivesicular body protein 4